jgi:hypothetical protein
MCGAFCFGIMTMAALPVLVMLTQLRGKRFGIRET